MVERTVVSPDGMKYTFTLRDGLRWHDGHPVLAEDCIKSDKALGQGKPFWSASYGARREDRGAIEKNTFTIELVEHFGPVLDALGGHRPPFMMPARIASTPAEQQIKEIIGSGPFKFARDEWQPGEQAIYLRNPDYIPRNESPSGSTGGKNVYVNRVIWRYIPDPWDASDALARGEVDWWQQPPLEFIPKMTENPNYRSTAYILWVGKAGSDRISYMRRLTTNRPVKRSFT